MAAPKVNGHPHLTVVHQKPPASLFIYVGISNLYLKQKQFKNQLLIAAMKSPRLIGLKKKIGHSSYIHGQYLFSPRLSTFS